MQPNAAAIGHNNPPTLFDEVKAEIDTLYDEAKNWLDGDAIENQAQADDLKKLKDMIAAARKKADECRKEENKPFDDGKAAVQAKYAELIADTKSKKGKAVLAIELCQKVLTPWNVKVQREKEEAERKAREEAEAKEREAQEAMRAAQAANDLQLREEAEAKVEEAKKAKRVAKKAGNYGATGLRTTYEPKLTDAAVAARHYWTARRGDIEALLYDLAKDDVRRGLREIPGFEIEKVQVAR